MESTKKDNKDNAVSSNNQKSASPTKKKRMGLKDLQFVLLIILTTFGTIVFIVQSKSWVEKLREIAPNFNHPSLLTCIVYTLTLTPIMLFIKLELEKFLSKFTAKHLDKKYYEDPELLEKGKKKLAINLVKCLYYFSISAFGYYVLKDLDFFPVEMGGKGDIRNMFNKGYPQSFLFKRPYGFDLHYFLNLAYTFVDFICIIFVYDRQSDFIVMVFHHYCTVSLIVVSYYCGYSNVGSLTMFLHNASDIIVYTSRTIIYTKYEKLQKPIGFPLLPVFLYSRQFLLARCIWALYALTNWDWHYIVHGIILLLCLMYVLHLNWLAKLIKIYYSAFTVNKIYDDYKLTKYKNNAENDETNDKEKKNQ